MAASHRVARVGRMGVAVVAGMIVVLGAARCTTPAPSHGDDDTGSSSSDDGPPPDSTGVVDSSSSTGPESTGPDSTGLAPGCGNGIVEASETCDDAGESATCDDDCTDVVCGDGSVNEAAGEACDGDELAGGTCEELGFVGGELACGAGCSYDTSACQELPSEAVLQLSVSPIKRFDFGWARVAQAEHYQLLESPALGEPFAQVGSDIVEESVSIEVPLWARSEASYVLRACNAAGCSGSAPVDVAGSLAEAVGYAKASNPGTNDFFGWSVALSADGSTLAVGAPWERSGATGIGGDEADDSGSYNGAVYVFVHDGVGTWSQQAYVKGSNTEVGDRFGQSVALSADGSTLAVGAYLEDSGAAGIGGNQADDGTEDAGAVYVLVRDGAGAWSQQAYVKASNPDPGDRFGWSVALSGNGDTLAVGAYLEDSGAAGIGGNQANDTTLGAGAAYVLVRDGAGTWSQQAYVKASNPDADDRFGHSVALSGNGDTLAVGAYMEDSGAAGIGGNQADDGTADAGAVYVLVRNGAGAWSQQAYVKASNPDGDDLFGGSVALSGDGDNLAVGAYLEDSGAAGIGGDQANDTAVDAGAAYVLVRDGAGMWSQQAYVKASNSSAEDLLGVSVALSGDGSILAVGAPNEASSATGIDGDQADDTMMGSGAVYMLVRDGGGAWSQQAYVKASNTGAYDYFGVSAALSGDGRTLAVGALEEDGSAMGLGGAQADDSTPSAGAVYLY